MSQKQNRRSFLGVIAAVLVTPFAARKGITLLDGGHRFGAKLYEIWSDRLDLVLEGTVGKFIIVWFTKGSVCFRSRHRRCTVNWKWDADEEDRRIIAMIFRNRIRQSYGLPPCPPDEPWYSVLFRPGRMHILSRCHIRGEAV